MKDLLIVLLCLGVNACIAAFEMAFVAARKADLRKASRKGDPRAIRLLKYRENPERSLSVLQIGINLVGALSAAVGGAGAHERLAPLVQQWFQVSPHTAEFLALLAVVLPLTYLTVVVGELVPKSLALRHSKSIALKGLPFLVWADRLLSPLVRALEVSTKLMVRLLSWGRPAMIEPPAEASLDLDAISSQGRQYVLNLVNIENKRLGDVMVPWSEVTHVSLEDDLPRVKEAVLTSGHTRLPVWYRRGVAGIVHTKEFMSLLHAGEDNWTQILRSVLKVQDSDLVLPLLRAMQEKKSHMAVVHDSRGAVLGIVTLEDIMEEVVGDISDEDDQRHFQKIFSARARDRLRLK
jgi:putative hemolysin